MAGEDPLADFEALYRESRDDVYAFVAGMLRDRAAAEDVTALAFERALRRRSMFDPSRGSARGWVFGIARNAALDELRRRPRQATLAAEPQDADASVEDHAERALDRSTLRAALATLDDADREIVVLKFHGGLSNAELGEALGISPTNAGTRLHRAMTRLRRACHAAAR